ncbi:MAG: MarR family winged helix-turn-helix transcriptional regulator [Methyloligellaceae bacterium]
MANQTSKTATAEGAGLADVIERLSRVVRAAEHEAGLNPAQWEALRYLARCNRFSNSPGALTDYLGATKGTVSQTLIALVRKGLVIKGPRQGQRRSVALELTEAGRTLLEQDPWRSVERTGTALPAPARRLLADCLGTLLAGELARNGLKTFGFCRGCRFFEPDGAPDDEAGPHRCGLLDVTLEESDATRICVEHEPKGAAR